MYDVQMYVVTWISQL